MTLYNKSSGYLEAGGSFCTIENPFLKSLVINWWPKFLGGPGGTFKGVNNSPSGANAKIASEWFEKGWIKEVPIDSTFGMEEALKVLCLSPFYVSRNYFRADNMHVRLLRGKPLEEQVARSLSRSKNEPTIAVI